MKKQRYAAFLAVPVLSLALFAGHAAAPQGAAPEARNAAAWTGDKAGAHADSYAQPTRRASDRGREVDENGSRGIEFSVDDVPSTGYAHPYYRYEPIEIVPLEPGI